MVIERKKLLKCLGICMPGIETGTAVLAGADSFIFHDGRIFSCNDSIAVSVPLSDLGIEDESLEGCVKANEFYKVVSKFTKDEINFVPKETSWLLKCGKAKAEITLIDFDYSARLKGIETKDEWTELSKTFIDSVAECRMNNNKSRFSGMFFTDKKIITTDSFQLNVCNIEDELPNFWISDDSVNELVKIKNINALQLDSNWVHFKTEDGTVLSVRLLQTESYPLKGVNTLIKNCTPSDKDFHSEFPKELISAIDRASSFSLSVSEHAGVRLTLSKEHIVVSSERTSGKYSEKVSWDKEITEDFEELEIYVDYDVINTMAKKSLEFYILGLNGISPKLLITTKNSFHLMMVWTKK